MENKKELQSLKNLIQDILNEGKKKVAKKSKGNEKMADKDYDGDGEVESSKDEYFGSKDKAIKEKMKKKGKVVSKDKKKVLKEGTQVSDGQITYGGFPRTLKEQSVTSQFNDGDDAGQGNQTEPIATHSDSQETPLSHLQAKLEQMLTNYEEIKDLRMQRSMAGQQAREAMRALEQQIFDHPDNVASRAAAAAARAAEGPGFFSQRGDGRPMIPSETLQQRGLNLGPRRLPPNDYEK